MKPLSFCVCVIGNPSESVEGFLCVYVHVRLYVAVRVHVCMEARGLCQVSSSMTLHFIYKFHGFLYFG